MARDADREHDHDRDGPDRRRVERLLPVLQATGDEREAQDEQAVAQDRADEGRLDQDDQALAQGEQRDEQLRQVAQRRLEDAGRPWPEAPAELLGALAHERRQHGQGDRRDDEHGDVRAPPSWRASVAPTPTTAAASMTTTLRPRIVDETEGRRVGRHGATSGSWTPPSTRQARADPSPADCATMCYMSERDRPAHVGVRELRQNLSVYLDRVKTGETLVVTEHGHPVARLMPNPPEPLSIVDRMIAEGQITPATGDHRTLPRRRGSRVAR